MQEPLPSELFVEKYSNDTISFKGGIPIYMTLSPLRKTWMPFFRELTVQIKKQICAETGKKNYKYYEYFYEINRIFCEGDPYYVNMINYIPGPTHKLIMKMYFGELSKIHYNGYAYNRIDMVVKNSTASEYIWIRWKSNVAGYEYIQPDDELDLQPEDITFEICKGQLPEGVLNLLPNYFWDYKSEESLKDCPEPHRTNYKKRYEREYKKLFIENNCDAWIEFMKDEKNLPRKQRKNWAAKEFPYEFATECGYPDTIFTIYFKEEVSKEIEEDVEKSFIQFMEEYSIMHKKGIHDVSNVKDILDNHDNKTVQMAVDFGNCDPKVITKLIKWLEKCDLNIERLIIS